MKDKVSKLLLLLIPVLVCCSNSSNSFHQQSKGLNSEEALSYVYFKDLFPFVSELNLSTVYGVTIEYGYIGTAPENSVIKTLESTKESDIKYNLDILNDPLIEDTYSICGGSYRTITYWSTLNTLCEITFSNGFIFSNDKTYKLIGDPIRLPEIEQ